MKNQNRGKMFKYLVKKLFWGFLRHVVSDKQYAQIRYWLKFDRLPDLKNPGTFTEKIQYIKLFDRIELRKVFANRLQARDYVAEKVGKQYLIPIYGTFEALTHGAWNALPSHFVLKANHGCGMMEIVREKQSVDYNAINQKTRQWQATDYYKVGREWVYKDVPRTILAEKLLLNSGNSIPEDYKFFCFNGRVELIQIDKDRFGDQRRNLYDKNFQRLDAKLLYPNFEEPVGKPEQLDQAIHIAETLSAEVNFVRVDLYLMENDLYFGELTNYPGNGFVEFEPHELALRMGRLLQLNS